ncbi:MAG: dTDP-4-dehydrorhamnose reductase [Acidobacteriota bacterium]|nr:dTDP-4-dehydrorhamnose reductase [Acidobacteriota bacterium]
MAKAAKILLTGASGQVGAELLPLLRELGEVVAPDRAALNLEDTQSVRAAVRDVAPLWIVNPAAYTAVDLAESEPDRAYAVNRDAVRVLGEEAARLGAGVLHFSTDYVFDGTAGHAYREQDATAPANVYGASKLAGEQALAASGAAHIILRTSWVYGATGKNFLRTILRLARQREVLRVVADQTGAPTWSRDLARLTAHVLRQVTPLTLGSRGGVYHAAGRGETTWCGFAAEGVRLLQEREPEARLARIEPITTAEYPTPARRPANSRLDGTRLAREFGWQMMDWHDSLRIVMGELAEQGAGEG